MQAIFHYACSDKLRTRLLHLAPSWLDIRPCPEADDDLLFQLLADTEVLLHALRPVDARIMEAAPGLRLVQKIGVGVNTIDLEHARGRGIAVCNMPGTNSRAVAEAALMLMLATLRRARRLDAATRAGEGWRLDPALFDDVGEIAGRTVGLVGYGAVPSLLAPVLVAMGARVLYTATAPKVDAVAEWRALDALLAESDVVSLHVPLVADTEHLIDAGALTRMKRGAVLINTARGGLVDQHALVEALRSGRLLAAGLDVFEEEPIAGDAPLLDLDNVLVQPHVAWLTQETLGRSLAVAMENCRRLREGETLLHRVA
ncbi:MAG: hydroxyacid dehydrogenase [Gammaproteobacteria bacterium]|nr:hydroxyacid dehydrogenase [Gammaproteobacteria bacterium]NIM74197.1 hydroxyacid dehydrogenase [Gammaproteobacteria bacterium]NIN39496.1 hydroxyacid dehydrogenase [Gammaproteobacteria bacterium]NIO25969.1 hydroxyacid dehydrogenase [Gammaproteobacteria bacterium]NIO66602.1 hydroxyacid dehydrogenase [Gammaproteobacteria bacterium]